MVAEVAVWDCVIVAFPATTCPLVGSAIGGSKGTAGFAKTVEEKINKLANKKRVKLPANLLVAKSFFNGIFKERSNLSWQVFFN